MMRGLKIGRIQVASRALGVGQAAFEDALQREAFGKPIWQHSDGRQRGFILDKVERLADVFGVKSSQQGSPER